MVDDAEEVVERLADRPSAPIRGRGPSNPVLRGPSSDAGAVGNDPNYLMAPESQKVCAGDELGTGPDQDETKTLRHIHSLLLH